ncbi:hypothetical protein AAC387_Pa09g1457 [Persea americana]
MLFFLQLSNKPNPSSGSSSSCNCSKPRCIAVTTTLPIVCSFEKALEKILSHPSIMCETEVLLSCGLLVRGIHQNWGALPWS